MKYDIIIIGAGPGGIFSAYELVQQNPDLKIAVFEAGHPLEKRHCPIDGAVSAVQVLFPTENTTSPTLSAVRCMNTSAKIKPSIS